jgi:hypothetical protein
MCAYIYVIFPASFSLMHNINLILIFFIFLCCQTVARTHEHKHNARATHSRITYERCILISFNFSTIEGFIEHIRMYVAIGFAPNFSI